MDSDGHTGFSLINPEIIKLVLKVQSRNEADKKIYLLHDRNRVSIDSIDPSFRKKKIKR